MVLPLRLWTATGTPFSRGERLSPFLTTSCIRDCPFNSPTTVALVGNSERFLQPIVSVTVAAVDIIMCHGAASVSDSGCRDQIVVSLLGHRGRQASPAVDPRHLPTTHTPLFPPSLWPDMPYLARRAVQWANGDNTSTMEALVMLGAPVNATNEVSILPLLYTNGVASWSKQMSSCSPSTTPNPANDQDLL
jgi:hypothetical protein